MNPHSDGVWSALAERFPQVRRERSSHQRFSLENGAQFLMHYFDCIELRVRRDALRFPDPAPWAAYLKSCRRLRMDTGHTDAEWADVSAMIDHIAREQFTGGELVVPKLAGAFLCTMPSQNRSHEAG